MALDDVMKIRAGDVLPIDIETTLEAKVDGVPVMRCSHGQLNGQYAVKVLELLPAAHQDTQQGEHHDDACPGKQRDRR
jgi:flagellar motor switch protein FliM